MPRIPQHIIDQILNDTDIVEVVSSYVPLKKMGGNFKACCPFHQEKSPSFVVSPEKNIYHCFGCGVGGNVIGFVMDHEKLGFVETVQKLADRLGIALPKSNEPVDNDPKQMLYKINAYAQWFFANEIKQNTKVKGYVQMRGLSPEVSDEFELGYAPDSFDTLVDFLQQKKIPLDAAIKLGLAKAGKQATPYAFYRDRLMFPIRNTTGKIVGFGGRSLNSDNVAKYINSPESPIYNKSQELYGFYQAKQAIKTEKQAIVVEGYLDVIACHQLGLKQAVAPLGTSLTQKQVRLLKRYTEDLILMFDGDNAGRQAAHKAVKTCLVEGFHPRICLLEAGMDPGDYLKQPPEALNDQVQKSQRALDFLISQAMEHVAQNRHDKPKVLRKLIDYLNLVTDPLVKIHYRSQVAEYFDISVQEIEKIVEITRNPDTLAGHNPMTTQALSLESLLVVLYLNRPSSFDSTQLIELSEDFADEGLKNLVRALESLKKDETFDLHKAIQELPQDLQGLCTRLLLHDSSIHSDVNISDCIHKFKQLANKQKLKKITAQIVQADLKKDQQLKLTLLKQKQQLLSE
jgi:DNA primase